MKTDTYRHFHVTNKFLKEHNFKYSRGWSEDGDNAYLLFVPVHRYHNLATLELRIVVYESGETRLDVIDCASRGVYSPWYRGESYERYPILKEIDVNIDKIMTSLGFKKTSKEKTNGKKSYCSKRIKHGSGTGAAKSVE